MRKLTFSIDMIGIEPGVYILSAVSVPIPKTGMRWVLGIGKNCRRTAGVVLTPVGITPPGEYLRVQNDLISYLNRGD